MNDLEKLISNLSTYWDITPEQVVDRLNFMNESEINKVVDKMKQKFKNGGVTYTKSTRDGISHMYGGGYKPNLLERIFLGMKPVDEGTEQNWQQLIENHRNDPAVKDKTQKKHEGGELEQYPRASRRDAIRAAMDEMNMSRSQARSAYRNMKNGFRNAGLSGSELRQRGRYGIIDTAYPRAYGSAAPQLPVLNDDIDIEDTPIDLPTGGGIDMSKFSVPNVKKIDTFGGSFNSAFAAARRSGLSEFTWNGGRYDTKLASEDPVQASTGQVKSISQQAASGAKNAASGYKSGTLPGSLYKPDETKK